MGLTRKILLFTSAIVVVLVVSTLLLTTREADRLAREAVEAGVGETRAFWTAFETDRYSKLRLGLRVLANDPYFKAATETRDEATILDMLRERSADLAADFVIATDPDGSVLARSDRTGGSGEDLSKEPVVAGALESEGSATVWRQGTRLLHAVSVPMTTGSALKGVLIAGHRIDEALAHQIQKLTHGDIAFVSRDSDGTRRLVTSSLGARETALAAALPRLPGPAADGRPFDLELASDRYVALLIPLTTPSGETAGELMPLRSLEAEMAPHRRFRQSLLLSSLSVMAVALVLAYLAARRVTTPLRRLVALVDRARDGSFTGAVSVDTHDEIGVLARTFNNLLADLREKEQLIGFLRDGLTIERDARTEGASLPGTTGSQTRGTTILSPGTIFAERYLIGETLGRGGMGVVYLADDRELEEKVALKLLRSEALEHDPALVPRFKQEIRLARRVSHRNILRTHDFGEALGIPFISMEYVEGVTLKDLVRSRGALPVPVGLRIAKQICLGLEAAHAEGVVHRDIKPQNMLILPETGDVKIMDFGIAQASEMKDTNVTSTGLVLGTPAYMPPEQARGQSADFRSDIYSLGIVLYELFTGALPFKGDSVMSILLQQIQDAPPPPASVNPKLPPALGFIILRCLEKDPARRYARASDLLAALSDVSSNVDQPAA